MITEGPPRFQTSIAADHWGPNAYDYVALFSVLALCKYIHFYKPTITIGLAGLHTCMADGASETFHRNTLETASAVPRLCGSYG